MGKVVGMAVEVANVFHLNLCTRTKFHGASFKHQLGKMGQEKQMNLNE